MYPAGYKKCPRHRPPSGQGNACHRKVGTGLGHPCTEIERFDRLRLLVSLVYQLFRPVKGILQISLYFLYKRSNSSKYNPACFIIIDKTGKKKSFSETKFYIFCEFLTQKKPHAIVPLCSCRCLTAEACTRCFRTAQRTVHGIRAVVFRRDGRWKWEQKPDQVAAGNPSAARSACHPPLIDLY